MKTLPRWSIAAIVVGIIALSMGVVSQFASKSTVFLQGQVAIDDSLVLKAEGIRTLFIVLFDADSPRPMPYGAVRFLLNSDAHGVFHHFVITRDNLQRMNPNSEVLPRNLRAKARLDLDGVAGADQAGDLVGEVGPVALGAKVSIVIGRAIE